MKKIKNFLTLGVLFLFSFSVIIGCGGKKMSDEDFQKITSEVITETMKGDFGQSITNPEEYSKKCEEILKEVCKKYGYSVSDYENKAKEVMKDFK